jgi:hypothetical protein
VFHRLRTAGGLVADMLKRVDLGEVAYGEAIEEMSGWVRR